MDLLRAAGTAAEYLHFTATYYQDDVQYGIISGTVDGEDSLPDDCFGR